jgi:hypothetical protein
MRLSWDEYEPETTLTLPGALGEPDLTIEVAKVGGGTVGRAYTGWWQIVVTYAGREVYRTDDLHTGSPCTHRVAARHLAAFLAAERVTDPLLARRLDAWADEP